MAPQRARTNSTPSSTAYFTTERVHPVLAATMRLPQQPRRSLTWDRGKEMAEHLQFSIDSGVQVYFCDPRSPCSVVPTRTPMGCLRQYLSKSSISLREARSGLKIGAVAR
jgi:IS30 family transposase